MLVFTGQNYQQIHSGFWHKFSLIFYIFLMNNKNKIKWLICPFLYRMGIKTVSVKGFTFRLFYNLDPLRALYHSIFAAATAAASVSLCFARSMFAGLSVFMFTVRLAAVITVAL